MAFKALPNLAIIDNFPWEEGWALMMHIPAKELVKALPPPPMQETMQQLENEYLEQQAQVRMKEVSEPMATSSPVGSANTSYALVVSSTVASPRTPMAPPGPPGLINVNDPSISAEDRVQGLTMANLNLTESVIG